MSQLRQPSGVFLGRKPSIGSFSELLHHIRIKFICDYARRGIVVPKYVESRLMKADLLTKASPAPRMAELRQIVKLT
jgi:hypothetical protein